MTQPTTTATATAKGALGTLVTVFFFWGFIAAGNNVFIPFCKHFFNLDQFQSQLIDFAFYLAYYVGALVLFGSLVYYNTPELVEAVEFITIFSLGYTVIDKYTNGKNNANQ